MQSDDRKKRKPASKPVKRRARSQKTTNVRRDSASPAGSSSIRPENMSLTSMLETLKPHDHLCLIYQSREEWRAAVVPFILIGLKRGEKCIYIVDTSTADEIRKYLAEEGIDVASAEKSGQLSILHETEVYTSEGSVGPDEIVDFLASEAEKAIADGYPALRVTGEMTWILRDHPGSEKLLEYEAKLNRDFFPKYPCLAICQYDRWKFDPEIIKGVIMTHPLVVRGNRIYRNFYYITPEEFLNDKRTVKEVQHWLDNIEREQQTEEKYLTVLEEMDEGYYELDLAGNWTFFNDTFCSSLGYTREELTGINYRAVTFEGDADTLYKIFEEAYRTGKVAKDINFRVVCKDGSIRSIEASALPVRNAEGNIIGFRGIGRDITERKKAEEALANEAVRRRVLMDESSDGIVVLDEKGKVYDVNRRFAEMLGYSIEEARELHVWDWDTQWPREQLLEMVRTVDEAGDHFETYHRRKDGTVFDVEISTNGAMIAEQKLVFCVCRDVTGRKRAEEALRDREARFRYLFEHSQVANALVGLDGKIIDVNQSAAELYGYDKSEIVGMDLLEFIAPESRAKVTEAFASGLVHASAVPVEVEVAAKGGKRTFFFPGGYHMLFEGDKETGFLISAIDVTERKQVEERMRHLNLVLRAIRNVNQLIARGADRDSLLKGVCENFVNTRGYHNAWIALPDESGKLVIAAEAGMGENFLQVIEQLKRGELPDCGWKALKKTGIVVIEDPLSECTDCPLAKAYSGRGGMSIRLEYAGKVYGMMAVSTPLGFLGHKEEHDLFEEVAGDIAFALHSMEQEEERSGAEEALRDSEERYRRLIETAYEGVWVVDDEGRTTFVNSRMAEMLGYTADEMVDKSLFLFMDEEWKAVAEKKLGRRRMGIVEQYEFKFHRKDGSELWTTIAASPISDKDGRYAGSLMMVTDVTEHKRADEALAEEAIRRRVLMERSRDGISVLDENSELVEANQRFAEMMGYTPEELKGLHSWDWDTQWTREELLEMGRNVDEAGAHLETRHRRKDGTVFDVEISVNSAVVAGKKLLFCVSRDITERKRAEEALRRSEQNFRDSMENSPLGIRVLGEGGETVYANRALLDMWGYSSVEELEAVPKKQRYAPDSYAAHMERSEKRKRGEPAPLSYETGIVRSDGQVRHLSASRGELLWNGEKRFQLVYQDITERKQAELALQKSEQKHHSLVEDTSVGIASIDMAGNLTFVNRAVCNLSGYAESKMLGKSFADFLYPDDVQPVMELFLDAAADQRDSADMEFRVIDRKGRVVHLHASVTRVKQENETVGFNTMMTDITERKQMERELAIRNRISDIFLGFPGDEMYGEVLQVILAVTESKYGIFGYIDEHGTLVAPSMTRDIWEKCQVADRSIRCPRERWGGIWGRALVEKKSLYANKGLHLPEGHIPLKRVLVVPVMYKGEVIGLLEVADCVADYNDDDKRFLEAIADHIAPILHARLWRDREERKRERAEEEYQTIISTSMDGFIVHDMQGNNLDVNEAYCRLIGYSRDELLNMSVSDIEVAEKPEETAEHIQKAKKVGYDRFETRHRRKDGGIVDVDVSVNYLPTDGGRMFVFIRDISERKRIEKELRTSRDYLDRTLNTIVEILMVVDTDYNILDINRSFLEHYGGKRKDIIGRKCYEVLHMLSEPCSAAQRRCPLKIVLNTGKPFHAEHIYEAVEGQKFIFEVSMFPLVDSAGNIEAVVEMQHDITESKRAEEEKGLLEQKAQVASRLASVGEMAAGIAHEINNPLTSVIGYSQLLADRDDIGEDVRMDLKAIDEGAQRVAGIIRRLLTFARQTRPERTLANVNELITNTLDLRDYHLRTNNIKVTTQLATDLPITTADPAQLQQVFLNIIVNAETAMKLARGKGKLLIKTEEVNGTIRISFKDNGPGIARENLERIFDPFFTTREVGEGTGLGLSICHGIIAEHKGRMWVESEKGKGATFIVELPIVVEPTRLEMVEPAGEKPPKAPRAKILVVDDEPSTLDFLSRLLTNEGHGVDTVSNAAEAFEMVKNKRYSLILLDIKMPGASGIELYGRMQKIAQSFAERVIFITGDIMGTDTEAFLSRTKAPYLTKPFDVNQLKKKIEHFLTGGQ
jgi:PAS domain S-box-containing protein